MSLEEKVKTKVLELGADFVGIAPRSRFENAPHWARPENLLPDYQSVISYGIAINRGSLKAWFAKTNRRPQVLSFSWDHHLLQQIARKLLQWLERQGFDSAFVASNGYYNAYRLQPDFSQRHAAVAAGLGKLGRGNNFVHPEFGGALRLCSVITEAKLEPDPLIAEDFDFCAGCDICIDICPTRAIARKKTMSFVMDGREFTHQLVNKGLCLWGCAGFTGHHYKINGRTTGTWAYNDLPVPIKEIKAAEERGDSPLVGILESFKDTRYRKPRHPYEIAEGLLSAPDGHVHIGTEYCGNCQRVCVGTMEGRRALMDLHINSGPVQIPDDPSLLNHLRSYNGTLQPYPIPDE